MKNDYKIPVRIVNNTTQDISAWRSQVLSSLEKTGKMPKELAEFFEVTRLEEIEGQISWILDYPKYECALITKVSP